MYDNRLCYFYHIIAAYYQNVQYKLLYIILEDLGDNSEMIV